MPGSSLREGFASTRQRSSPRSSSRSSSTAPPVGPPTDEARGKDAGVVDDEQVAGLEELREAGEDRMLDLAAWREPEQPRPVALGERLLSDELRRKLVVEVVEPHGRGLEQALLRLAG